MCVIFSDVMCGLLHCDHQSEKLIFWKDVLALATPTTFLTVGPKAYKCSGVSLDVGLNMPDPGMVPDGAKCGEGKVICRAKWNIYILGVFTDKTLYTKPLERHVVYRKNSKYWDMYV